ncbi:MAG TPA: dTDP-4-dehydrorhamnose reductase [Wenzhouxiangella sp.]|nr:dTDP-4-dehydrorhamnose reductase [Wenzhouxiangella sp.]
MTTLLLGAGGQLGRHLRHELPEALTCARSAADYTLDLTDHAALGKLLDQLNPQVIVNAAAWTAVDDAEDNEQAAFELNRDLPALLAAWTQRHKALLVHYSTDYVFSGHPGRPWREDDVPAPQSVYGHSKLAGERAIAAAGCRAWILRTAWVYSALPGNFVSAILGRAADGHDLKVVADQTGSPTWAGTLAQATVQLLKAGPEIDGAEIVHVAGQGAMSWHALAERAVQRAARHGIIPDMVKVEPITSDQWPQKAQRPAWSVLDGARYQQLTGQSLPDSERALEQCLQHWSEPPC